MVRAGEPHSRDRLASPPRLGQSGPTQYQILGTRGRPAHGKGRGKSSLVGSQVSASDVSRVGLQVGQEPSPRPAPRVGPTPAPMAPTSKCKTAASENVPRPRPPPKPGAGPSPSIASRAVQALAATAATSHTMNFVPRRLATARSDFPQVDAHNGAQLAEIQRLRDAAWEAMGTATVDGSERHRY